MKKEHKEMLRRKLTWKYFWEQKCEELCNFIKVFSAVLFVGFIIPLLIGGYVISHGYCKTASEVFYQIDTLGIILYTWATGVLCCLIIALILIVIGAFIFYIGEWLLNNWEIAKARARRELK